PPRSLASCRTGGLAIGLSVVPARPEAPSPEAAGELTASAGARPAPDPPPAFPLRCRRVVVPSFTPYPTSTACRSIFGAGEPWIPGSKAACSGDSAPAGVEVAAVTGSARPACPVAPAPDAEPPAASVVAEPPSPPVVISPLT